MKLAPKLYLITFIVLMAQQVHAGVIYDEAVSGDASIWWTSSNPTQLGTVSDGDYVLGTVDNNGLDSYGISSHWDGYRFTLDGSFTQITIDWISGVVPSNAWQLYGSNSDFTIANGFLN